MKNLLAEYKDIDEDTLATWTYDEDEEKKSGVKVEFPGNSGLGGVEEEARKKAAAAVLLNQFVSSDT